MKSDSILFWPQIQLFSPLHGHFEFVKKIEQDIGIGFYKI